MVPIASFQGSSWGYLLILVIELFITDPAFRRRSIRIYLNIGAIVCACGEKAIVRKPMKFLVSLHGLSLD